MVISFLTVNITLYQICKSLDADGIFCCRSLAPVASSFLAHEAHIGKDFHNIILNEIKIISCFCPGRTESILELFLEFCITAFFRKFAFQVCQKRNCSAEALHLIKDLQKYRDNGILVLLTALFALGINVKEHNICRYRGSKLHICKHHGIFDLFVIFKICKSRLSVDNLVLKKI